MVGPVPFRYKSSRQSGILRNLCVTEKSKAIVVLRNIFVVIILKERFAVSVSIQGSQGHSFFNLFIFTTADGSVVKRLSLLHYSLVDIFWPFVITEPFPGFLENLYEDY